MELFFQRFTNFREKYFLLKELSVLNHRRASIGDWRWWPRLGPFGNEALLCTDFSKRGRNRGNKEKFLEFKNNLVKNCVFSKGIFFTGVFMKTKKILALGACALSLLFTVACSDEMDPNDPASVRKHLTKQGIPFTPNKFMSYIAQNDTAAMSLFLKAAYDINSTDGNGNSAVAIAVNKGKVDILQYLIQHGAKLDGTNSNGKTYLEDAIENKHREVAQLLISKMQESGEIQSTAPAVALAAKTGDAEVLKMLGDAGAPLEVRGADSYFPIHLAVKGGNYDAMIYLISKGVDVNAKCGQGYSVLDWAKNEGYTRLIAYLKKHGAKNTPAYIKEFGK